MSNPAPRATAPDAAHAQAGMAARVLAFDWSTTPLGAIGTWSPALVTAVNMVLSSHFPQCLVWGPGLTTIHNDAFRKILGDKGDALGRSFAAVWAEAWEAIAPIADRAFAGEATFIEDFPLRIQRSHQPELAYFTFCYSPVRDERGQVCGMLDTVVETTGKVTAERQLQRNALALERQVSDRTADRDRLWQLSSDVMVVTRIDGTITSVNPAWTRVLGWSPAELIGANVLDFVHPDDRTDSRHALQQLAQGLPLRRADNRYLHRDGGFRWISWAATPSEGLFSAVGRDITAEREQAEALRQAEDLLRHSQKMDAVGQLTGGIAHDFNNLLQGIGGSLQLIERLVGQQRYADLGRHVTAARNATRRAATLTHRLLAFSRRQALDPRPTDANLLVAGMLELIGRTVGPTIEVHNTPTPGLWPTRVDADQLESSLLNLCINARDAMPAGGRLAIALANRHVARAEAEALDLPPGDYVQLTVQDTGGGMTPEVQARAFDPFYTTKPAGAGTGLGLSMVYGFARQSGGQVRIDSAPGQGTSVRVLLPRSELPLPREEAAAGPQAPLVGPTAPGSALVVEDNPEVRQIVAETLLQMGLQVRCAEDGPSALKLLQAAVPVDLLVTDIGLPGGLDGRQVAAAARALRPAVKVLVITGYAESAVLEAMPIGSGMSLLAKPFEIEALQARAAALLDAA